MLGIVIGVAAVIAMVAIGSGAQNQVTEQIRSLGANLLLVQPGTATQGAVRLGAGTRPSLTEDDAAAIAREVPGVVVAAPAVGGPARWSWQPQLVDRWSAASRPTTSRPRLAGREGPRVQREEVDGAAKVALLGATVGREAVPGGRPARPGRADRQRAVHRDRRARRQGADRRRRAATRTTPC